MPMKSKTDYQTIAYSLLLCAASSVPLAAQSTAPATTPAAEQEQEEVIVLSPFEVTTEENEGYTAANTLAGNRLNTELRDIGNAVTVITPQFLKDIGATSNESLLQYTTGTEVGNIQGNFAGLGDGAQLNETDRFTRPNQNTRVRGLAAADNARDYFLTDIPWDGYNVDRVDLQRGPNSIMFGLGSPAGLINTTTQSANFKNSGEIDFRFGSYGTTRASINLNRELIDDELAVRLAVLRDDEKFKQDPAFDRDERVFGALRWEPGFLKRGSARTIVRMNFESGEVESNRPRTLPPADLITPWFNTGTYAGRRPGDANNDGNVAPGELAPYQFNELNKATFNAHQVQQDNVFRPNHGQRRPGINGGPQTGALNPSYQPRLGDFGQNFGGAPYAFYGANGVQWWSPEIREIRGIGPNGQVDTSLAFDFNRAVTIAPTSVFAKAAGVDFAEIYKNDVLRDHTVFDFYNNLIDGPNKEEWQDFDTWNVSIAQTFFNDKLGFELNYNTETYKRGQLSLLTDGRQSIRIDVMSVMPDGTPAGTGTAPDNIPYQDGTPNPNLGRPFITDSGQGGNNSFLSEREGKRATVFFTHDFEREGQSNTLTRILGRHTLTGLLSEDKVETDGRSWQRYAILDDGWRNFLGMPTSTKFNANEFAPSAVVYLGPSLLNASTASGANIPRVVDKINLAGTFGIRTFDSTWANPPGVDPAALWLNPSYLPPDRDVFANGDPNTTDRRISTQSENPANYVGWRNFSTTVTDSEAAPGNRDLLSTSANLTKNTVESKALVWQGHLWDNSIVGTYGYREDVAKSWGYVQDTNGRNAPGHLDLSSAMYHLPEIQDGEIVNRRTGGNNGTDSYNALDTVASRAYSIVAHLNELPVLSGPMERFPLNVSLFYNRSTNFQPLASRVDAYGHPIAAPEGRTTDKGVLFETKDGRYTFKVNQYTTAVTNGTSSGLSATWFIGSSQAWAGNWANHFEFNWTGDNIQNAVPVPNRADFAAGADGDAQFQTAMNNYNFNSQWNYGTAAGETQQEALDREAAAVSAWRTWQASVNPDFYAAWGIDLQRPFTPGAGGLGASVPQGFAVTEDTVSRGYEFEFSALPTRNWRVTFNASKSTATRTNIGGPALAEFINGYENALKNTAAGDLRIWWGGAGNETTLFQWNQNVGFEWTARKLQEGSNVPELRKWRFNAITNYDFTEGRLKGINVGGGIRYQDSVVIGYAPTGSSANFGIDLNDPYTGPSEVNFDFWLGYGRRFGDKIDWRIQLNVRNAFEGNDLIPITVQPDGTPAAYRIAPAQTWTVSNTFRF